MVETFRIEDFQIGNPVNKSATLYFATSKSPAFPKDNYAIKRLTFYDPLSFKTNEDNLKNFIQSVRSASILKPEAVSKGNTGNNMEIYILYEKMMTNLAELIENKAAKGVKFTPDEIKTFLRQSSLALEELEKRQIPHTNLKPKNILITLKADYKITDVGIQSMNEEGDYRAPEAVGFSKPKTAAINPHKADVFALGLILVQMMTLRSSKEMVAFRSQDGYNASKELLEEISTEYGRDLQKAVKDMLDPSETRRKSIIQMKDDLEEIYNTVNTAKKVSVEDKLVRELFEAIVQKLKKKDQNSSFFLKFNMNDFASRINRLDFLDAMQALEIRLNESDISMVARVMDPDNSGFFDMKALRQEIDGNQKQFKNAYDRLEALSDIEEKALRSILDDIHEFCRKNNIDYMAYCKSKDLNRRGSLMFDDLKFINTKIKLAFNESDYELIRRKYDKLSNNEINYESLIADMDAPYKANADNMSTIIKQFYLRVREVYNTVSEFFQKVDIDGSKTISREEFVTLVKNLRLNFNSTELNSIWIQLDKSNNGKVFPLNFRTIFTPFIDEDMRNLLMDLYRCLDNQGITFGELIKAYNKGGYIAFARLMDALKSINPSFSPRDLSFILNEFDIRNIQEINVQTLDKSISDKAHDLNLNISSKHRGVSKSPSNKALNREASQGKFYDRALNLKKSPGEILFNKLQVKIQNCKQSDVLRLFKNVDKNNDRLLEFKEYAELVDTFDNELNHSDKRTLFEFLDVDGDGKISSAEFIGRIYPTYFEDSPTRERGFIPEKYDYAMKFIQDIVYNLGIKRKTPEEHFNTGGFDDNMSNVEFRMAITQLGMKIDTNAADQFINSLLTPENPNIVNLHLFFKIINYFKNNSKKPQTIMNKFELSKIFKTINDAMTFQGLNYETVFAKFDRYNQNIISVGDFNYAINDMLRLNNMPNLNPFINYLLENENISLSRLYKGLFEEAHSNKLIQDLKNLIHQNNLNIDVIFKRSDYNEDSVLDSAELEKLLRNFDQSLSKEDAMNIFNKFDTNSDGKITLVEFRRAVSSDNASFDKEFLTQGFFENISILIQEKGYSLQQLFGKNTIDGKLPINYFDSGLLFIGYDKDRNLEKYKSVVKILTENMERNQINYSLMQTLYDRYRKQYQSGFLLSEEEKIRVKGFSRQVRQVIESRRIPFNKVFESRDKFGAGFLSSEDLKQILTNELYMDTSPDMILFIKSLSPLNDNKIVLKQLKTELYESSSFPNTPAPNVNPTPEQFFQALLPSFQHNPINLLNFLFENRDSIAKNDFLNRCASLNQFSRDQVLYVYSKLDANFTNSVTRYQVEPLLQPGYGQRPPYSAQGYPQGQPSPHYTGPPPPSTAAGNYYQGQGSFPSGNQMGGYPPQPPQQQPFDSNPIQSMNYLATSSYNQQSFAQLPESKIYQTQYINYQGQDMRNPLAINMNISPSLIRDISNYVQRSKNILLREFQQADRGMGGYLPIWDIKRIFQYNGYENITVEDLEQFGIYFAVCENKNINYKKLFEVCDNLFSIREKGNTEYQSSGEIEVVNRLREEILRQNLNLPMALQKYDKGNQMIFIREFTSELQARGINLRRDDLNLLLNKIKQNNINQINYIEMSNFIMNRGASPNQNPQMMNPQINPQMMNPPMNPPMMNPQMMNPQMNPQMMIGPQMSPQMSPQLNPQMMNPQMMNPQMMNPQMMNPQMMNPQMNPQMMNPQMMNTNPQMLNPQIINSLFENIKERIKNLYVSQGISLKALFRQIDLDSDNYISYKEFSDCLERKLQLPNIPFNQVEECFKRFDDDRDYKISYFEFSKHILNLGSVDHKKLLLKLKKQLLEKTNEEKDLLMLFKNIDQDGNGFLSFVELKQALHKFNINFTDNEMEDIFRYFDKDDKDKISYDHFVEVLNEDHLNLAPLRTKVNDIMTEKNMTPIAFFRSLNSSGDDQFLKRKEFGDFLKKLGFKYDADQEEDLFETFDQDKDYLISFEEFNAVILDNKKQDASAIVKRLRRLIFSQKIDLFGMFEAQDQRRSGVVSSKEFIKVLKRASDLSPVEIELLFKEFSNGGKTLDYLKLWEALLENNIDIQPIRAKFDELCERWDVDYEGLFEQFDPTEKGYLTWLDFDQMMLALQLRLPIEEVQEYFNAFDVNKNGKLTEAEFLQVLRGKKAKNARMKFDIDSPVWKRNSEMKNNEFVFKPNKHNKKAGGGGFNLKPIQTNFDDEEEDSHRKPTKVRKLLGEDEDDRAPMGFPNKNLGFQESLPKRPGFPNNNLGFQNNNSDFQNEEHGSPMKGRGGMMRPLELGAGNRGGIKEEFRPEELVDLIKKQAYFKKVRLFQVFVEFDRTRTCVLSNIRDLGTVLQERLDLRQLQWPDIEGLYQHYSPDEGKTMNFVRLIMDIDDPSSVLVEMIKHIMKIQNMSLEDVFRSVDKDRDGYWNIKEFSYLDSMLNVGMDKNEISQIFKQWDLNNNGFISTKELDKIFNFNMGPQKTPMHPSNFQNERRNEKEDKYFYQRKYQRTMNFLKYVLHNMEEKRVFSAQQLCESNENQVPRALFLKALTRIGVKTQSSDANDFLNNLSVENNPNNIDLREFEYLFRNFGDIFNDDTFKKPTNRGNEPIERGPMSNDINVIVKELKPIVEEEGFGSIAQYDRNGSGFISERDLYNALIKMLEPCDEIDIFVKYVSQNGKVSLEELKRIFQIEEKGGFEGLKMQSLGVKGNYTKAKVLTENERKFLNDAIEELKRASGKKPEDFVNLYFNSNDGSKLSLIDKEKFIQTSIYIRSRVPEKDLPNLFSLIDINDSGTVTRNEFLLLIGEPEVRVERNKGNLKLPDELVREIQGLFKEVDADGSGYVEKNELAGALMRVGVNPTNQEIDEYISRFDKDGDGKISYPEFEIIFKEKLVSDMMVMDELMGNLRREFKNADVQRNRLLNKQQLRQVFMNLDIDLSSEELEALFNEIDVDKSNTIDIDELIYFMTKNQEQISPLAASALMNIRLTKKLSLADFKDVFKNMPANFTLSFLRLANKKLKNLPSRQMKPKVDSSGLFYENLEIFHMAKDEDSHLKRIDPKFLYEIKLLEAKGVPIPSEKNVKREDSITLRELKISLFDQTNNKFISNTVNVVGTWSPNYEDRWGFARNYLVGENSIYVKVQDFDENKMKSVSIIFEFVIYFLRGGKLVEISCGYASMDLININSKSSTKHKLNLEGGAPYKKITIRKDDVQANRKGWRKVVKKITKDVTSQLEIEIIQIEKNSRYMNELKALPPFMLVNKFATSIFFYFREYLARRATITAGLDVNLASDIKVKTFLRCVDCPDTFERLCKFWNEALLNKPPNSILKIVDYMSKMIDQLYLLLSKAEFKFNSSDPTAITAGLPLFKARNEMLLGTFEDILVNLNMKPGSAAIRKNNENIITEPIMLNDAGSDSDEENFLSQLKKKAKKHAGEIGYGTQGRNHQQFGTGYSGNTGFTQNKGFKEFPGGTPFRGKGGPNFDD